MPAPGVGNPGLSGEKFERKRDDPSETQVTQYTLHCLRQRIQLAEKMAAGLGPGFGLFGTLSKKQENNFQSRA